MAPIKPKNEAKLKQLNRTQKSCLELITKIQTWVKAHGKSSTISMLRANLEQAQNHYQRYLDIQEELFQFDSDDEEHYNDVVKECASADNLFISLKAALMELIDEKNPKPREHTNDGNISMAGATRSVKLPKLLPPKFSGNYHDWIDFKNEFTSMIIQDNELTDIDRFRFLRSCLIDNAKQTISKMESSTENFKSAWKALADRYENKSLIFQSHVNAIIQLQSINKESAIGIRDMVDKMCAHFRALQSLGSKSELADNLLICLMVSKLDSNSVTKWEESTTKDIPGWEDFTSFLEKRACTLEKIEWNKKQPNASQSTSQRRESTSNTASRNSNRERTLQSTFVISKQLDSCVKCKSSEHTLQNCTQFIALSPYDRYQDVRQFKLCVVCLKQNHRSKFCKAPRCEKCGQRHHLLVHFGPPANTSEKKSSYPTPVQGSSGTQHHGMVAIHSDSSLILNEPAILATAVVNVLNRNADPIPVRALLDCGATTNLISERLTQILGVEKHKKYNHFGGVGQTVAESKTTCEITIMSRLKSSEKFIISAAILPKITDAYPPCPLSVEHLKITPGVALADPNFAKPQHIDLLLGAGLFWHLLLDGQIRLGPNQPVIQETKLGWIVSGPLKSKSSNRALVCTESDEPYKQDENLNEIVKRFWEIDAFASDNLQMNPRDQECEDHYSLHTRRNEKGKYVVRLPFSKDPLCLGQSMRVATHRFLNLERRLVKDPAAKQMYADFIEEYERLGHLEMVTDFDDAVPHYFLPHHCVMKPSSSTTKLRVVFDASCKTSSGISLNDILLTGPKLQDDLFVILLRFRLFRYVITGDIQKMYRQVLIEKSDSNFQLILWRRNKEDAMQIFRLNTVTYGTAAGSYLAIKTLHRLADDEEHRFPVGADILRRNFYVDDLMAGSNSISGLQQIYDETLNILKIGGFPLSKFCSNEKSFLADIDEQHCEKFMSIDDNEVVKALGLIWQPDRDVFRFTYHPKDADTPVTKRTVLSQMASLFDPLGLVCPVITLAKIFYQELWKLKLDWDKVLDEELAAKWRNFQSQMATLKDVSIPRHVFSPNPHTSIEIHGFADASEKAYGACVYARCGNEGGDITTQLLFAKSKVSPTKTLSIARLELLAAKLLCDIMIRLKKEVFDGVNIDAEYFWSDSQIALCWIKSEPHNWNVFVAHRVSKIQESSSAEKWRHVPGELNPADLVSRGMLPSEIACSDFWFGGPEFLKKDPQFWPSIKILPEPSDEIEEKRAMKFALTLQPIEDVTSTMNFSVTFHGTRRAFAYVYKFIHNSRVGEMGRAERQKERKKLLEAIRWKDIYRMVPPPALLEEEEAEKRFIRSIQMCAFPEDYELLRKDRAVSTSSPLRSLSPFIDDEGLMRVGGRLKRAHISYDAKHQILLPKTHQYSRILILFFHFRTLHAGPNVVLTAIRSKYWPISGLVLARSVLRACVWCYRMRPKLMKQIMGDLPGDRLEFRNTRPFEITGVDFAGPLTVRHHMRCKAPKKVYVAVFVCFRVKAVHLELVPDLTTEAFIRALKRFIADRGKVAKIYSDNGTNFQGTANQLREVKEMLENGIDAITRTCDAQFIEWSFIPPRAPNFGGLWEASVKIAKRLIRNVVGSLEITLDEMTTVIKQAAAIINSRPITSLSVDPNDFEPLTPGHFLYGGPPSALPELPSDETNINRVKLYHRLSWITQQYWKRFSEEYLASLQQRTKWLAKNNDIKVGTMVLLRDDLKPPLKWCLGRIVAVFPDKQGNIRVLRVKTPKGEYERSITGVAALPIEFAQMDSH